MILTVTLINAKNRYLDFLDTLCIALTNTSCSTIVWWFSAMVVLNIVNTRFRSCWNIVWNWIWPRSIFIIGSVWRWNWYCTNRNLNNVILWGIIPVCKIFAKTWHFLFCFGVCYSFWPFALTRECALHLPPCEKTRKTYFAGGLAGFSKTICTVPE